jgi:hypothetical protein
MPYQTVTAAATNEATGSNVVSTAKFLLKGLRFTMSNTKTPPCNCGDLATAYKTARKAENLSIGMRGVPDAKLGKRCEDTWNTYAAARESCPFRDKYPHY